MDIKWALFTVFSGLFVTSFVYGQSTTTPASNSGQTTTTVAGNSGETVYKEGFVITGYPFDSDVEYSHLTAITENINSLENYTLNFPGIAFSDVRMIILSCDADYARRELYFFDYNRRKIELLENFNTDMDTSKMNRSDYQLAVSETWNLIAVDWVNHNVYWTDGILGKIFIKKGGRNNDNRAIHVVKKGLSRPRGIAVDPLAGFIFWTDIQEDAIKRASLVGANELTVAYHFMSVPDSIALDMDNEILYWTDLMDINSIPYDGAVARKNVFRYSYAVFYDILLFQGVLIATDVNNYYTHYIDPATKTELFGKKGSDSEGHYGLCPYAEKPFPQNFDPDQCDNYGCDHICVKEPKKIEPTCLCWDGFKLADKKKCVASGYPYYRGIIINTGTQLCIADIQLVSDHKDAMPTCFYTAPSNKTISQFDINMKERVVYFSIENIIYWTYIDDTAGIASTITTQNHNILSMSYDWMNIMLYYAVDSGSGSGESQSIWRVDPNSKAVFPTRTQTGPSPRALAVSPHEGKVFWVTGTEEKYDQVEYTDLGMQSDNITTITSEEPLDQVTHMYHHVKSEYLYLLGNYWGGKEFYKMYYNGTAVTYPIDVSDEIKDFALYRDYILLGFVETSGITIKSSDLRYAPPLDIINDGKIEGLTNIVGLKVLDLELLQPEYPNPCGYTTVGDNGGCQHICYVNTTNPRQAVCACYMGFTAVNDTHCTSVPVQNNFILFSDKTYDALYQVDLNVPDQVIGLQTPKLSGPTGVIYNWDRKLVYTTNDDLGDIVAIYLNGTTELKSDSDGYSYPDRFAYDPSSKLIYYTAYSLWASFFYDSYIAAVDENGETTVIYTGAHFPRAIVLHPLKGYLFFTDHGDYPGIFRLNMDGSDWLDLEIEEAVWPNGLGIDYTNERLYWVDGYRDTIKSCDLEGQNVIEILKDEGSHPMGLKYVNGYLYYSGWNNIKIKKMKADNITDVTEFGPEHSMGAMQDLDVYIQGVTDQIPINVPCSTNNGGCSAFCLPVPNGRVCGCPAFSDLLRDNKTCDNVPRCRSEVKTASIPETDDCLRLAGQQCQFECIKNYKPKAGVSVLTCTNEADPDFENELIWDMDDPCEEIFCPNSISYGQLNTSCDRRVDADCIDYICNPGYEKNPEVKSLVCQVSGEWDAPKPLCIPKCPVMTSQMHHGVLHPTCTRDISQNCRFICDEGYRVATTYSRIDCQPGSQWNVSLSTICEEILCKDYINFGFLNETCTRKLGVVCEYICETGYQGNPNLPTLRCVGSGMWDHGGQETDTLCTIIPPEPEKTRNDVAIAVGIGVGVGVLIFLILLLAFFLWRTGRLGGSKSPPVAITSFDNPRYGDSETASSSGAQADKSFSYATLDEDKTEIVRNQGHEHVYDNPVANGSS